MFFTRFLCCAVLMVAAYLGVVPTLHAQIPVATTRQIPSSLPIFGNQAVPSPVERALASRVTLPMEQQSLKDFAALLRTKFQLNVVIDHRALDDVGLDIETQLAAIEVQNVELETVLTMLLEQVDLCFMLRDQIVVITTPEEAENHLSTHVYPVADLLGLVRSNIPGDTRLYADYDTLIEAMTSSIAPDTWDEVGGAGSIEPYPSSQALVISQTREVHKAIQALLNTLRKAKSIQPVSHVNLPSNVPSNVGSVPYRPGGNSGAGPGPVGPPPQSQGGFF